MKHTVLLALVLLGCSSPNTTPPSSSAEGERAQQVEEAVTPQEEAAPEADAVEALAPNADDTEPPSAEPEPETDAKLAEGASCTSNEQCASGTCEGEGCGDDTPGTCMPSERMCLRDLRPYCGCDGKTFMRGSNCPGQRYAARGPCDGDPPSPQLPPR